MNESDLEVWSQMQRDGAPDYREIAHETRRSRHERECDCCPHPIKKGERYTHLVYTLDGKFEQLNAHIAMGCVGDNQ